MQSRTTMLISLALLALVGITAVIPAGQAQKSSGAFSPIIPKTWDDEALASLELPLPEARYSPVHVSSDYYYRIPVRPIYKTYPVYHPDKEPSGYTDWLKQQEPEIIFDHTKLKTEGDWIKAGEVVFDFPIDYSTGIELQSVRNPTWYEQMRMPVAKNGLFPFGRYVVRQKGWLNLG